MRILEANLKTENTTMSDLYDKQMKVSTDHIRVGGDQIKVNALINKERKVSK